MNAKHSNSSLAGYGVESRVASTHGGNALIAAGDDDDLVFSVFCHP